MDLDDKQKEAFNYQKLSAVLADFGFFTIPLKNDWNVQIFLRNIAMEKLFTKYSSRADSPSTRSIKTKNFISVSEMAKMVLGICITTPIHSRKFKRNATRRLKEVKHGRIINLTISQNSTKSQSNC